MWKLLTLILTFIRETIYERKEEENFTSHEFNARKLFVLVMFALLFGSNIYLVNRLYTIADAYVDILKTDRNINNICNGKDIHGNVIIKIPDEKI